MGEIVECYTETHQNTNVISNAKTDMIISHRRHVGTELSTHRISPKYHLLLKWWILQSTTISQRKMKHFRMQ